MNAEKKNVEKKKLNLLVCEDDLVTSRMIKKLLEKEGHRIVASCSSGEEAVKLAAYLEPDLLIMDISLSGEIDGVSASELINRRLHIPVIFITSNEDEQIRQRAMDMGPLGYLKKPFDIAMFDALIA